MSLFRDNYNCYYPLSEHVQENQETHKNSQQCGPSPVGCTPAHIPIGNASIRNQEYRGEANRCLNPHNNDTLWRTILENKVQYFEKMAGISPPSSPTTITTLPSKASSTWSLMVTNPRFIKLSDQLDEEALLKLETSLITYKSDTQNHEAAVTFDWEDLARDANYYVLRQVNEATLEANVYRKHFLVEGHAHSAPPVKGRTLHRFIQPEFEYLNKLASPPPYSRETSNRRESALPRLATVWDISHSFPELKDKDRKGARFYPDHVYACQASRRDRDRGEFRKTRKLPAFRVVEGFECDDLIPIHFLNEDKALRDGYIPAMHYILFVSAIVLHERLLLSSLAQDTLKDQQFQLEDSHRVFFMTCCGHIATLHEMRLRNIWILPNPSKMEGQPVAYDAIELAQLDMTKKADCELLKRWLNAIHEWGSTIHYDSVLEDGIAAAHRQATNPMDLRNLHQRAFSYGKEPETIKYHLWRGQVAIDGNTSEEQGGAETEWEDTTTAPSKTKRSASVQKKKGEKLGKKLGKRKPITVLDTPQEGSTSTKGLVHDEKSTAPQPRRSIRLMRTSAVKTVHVGVSWK